jgi:3,4-dihydroxy 2-butanone 4-phosphate synthase/GTP cyclohydrolase II
VGSASVEGTGATCPLEGWQDDEALVGRFASVEEALQDVAMGKFVVVLDDEGRENEGDLIAAAGPATPEALAFMVRHTSGLICVGMEGSDLDRLGLPLMVENNEEHLKTAFTLSVDKAEGTTTGISAADRAATVSALGTPESRPETFVKPGHVFPLRASEGGTLKRAGHTEAAVDLARLAGYHPAGILSELQNDDGTMMRGPELLDFADEHGLKAITIADLIVYRRMREVLVERTAVARLPTKYGRDFRIFGYKCKTNGIEHVAMVCGDVGDGDDILVRVHSECLTGDIFASARCDCGPQLQKAMEMVAEEGRGVIVYLRGQEGRGIGLGHKLRAYNLQDSGRDTVDANLDLGLPVDSREYGIGAHILKDVGVNSMRLMTNNPAKYTGLKGYGLEVSERVGIVTEVTADNAAYIQTKRDRMGHFWDGDEGDLKAFANAETNLEPSNLEGFESAASLVELANGTHEHTHAHAHGHGHGHGHSHDHDHVHGPDGSCPNQVGVSAW